MLAAFLSVGSRPPFAFIAKYHGRRIDQPGKASLLGGGNEYALEAYEFDADLATIQAALSDEMKTRKPNDSTSFAFLGANSPANAQLQKSSTKVTRMLVMRRRTWFEKQWAALKNRLSPSAKTARAP